jgi:IclR helix-turn-helix domain
MLEKLLQLVGEGGVHSYDELAERLGVPRPLVEAMIHDLARLGYLRPAVNNCEISPACRVNCGLAGCSTTLLWTLTDKGAQVAFSSEKKELG